MKFSRTISQQSLCLLFALSGFTGIIYESVWSWYLKLFLGHAAYAQALVLVIFMGGMSLGAWICSRFVNTSDNLLRMYALVEAAIGLSAFLFDPAYRFITSTSFESIIPALSGPMSVQIYKFLIASIMILPQSLLLGATFPLLTSGFIRRFPETPGKTISILYFVNSAGAAIALLFITFYLINRSGLPGTLMIAGVLNVLIALVTWILFPAPVAVSPVTRPTLTGERSWMRIILAASCLSGVASFIYEVSWIRMLSMVLGSSTHSFELMLSAFISGLALGGYWIRKRIDTLDSPVLLAGSLFVLMGLAGLSTLFLYSDSFTWMAFFMSALDETSQGYLLFNLASHGIALLIMLPATICAGMTLPLLTFILLQQGHGEKSIGRVYSINTLGAIAGILFTIFIGMPVFTLKGSIIAAVIINVGAGLMLLWYHSPALLFRRPVYLAGMLLIGALIIGLTHKLDPRLMASGVYRLGNATLDKDAEILYHADGQTASITVSKQNNDLVTIATNGKPDASITLDDKSAPSTDESTMTLLAALPLSIYPGASTIANIGMGSGMTTHTALAMPGVHKVDTIEIEPAVVEGAGFFRPRTERAFSDPRSQIHIEDAKTFFSMRQSKYDIIISEPSNPWVSGVSSLFTREFYTTIKSHLATDGMFVQWIHIYEFNIDLLVSILKAVSAEFPFYSIYFADDGNLILLARNDRPVGYPEASLFDIPDMKTQLARIYITNVEDLRFRYLGDQSLYKRFLDNSVTPMNSDYYPYLDLNAAKSRFTKEDVTNLLNLRMTAVPVLDILYETASLRNARLTRTHYYPYQKAEDAYQLYDAFINGEASGINTQVSLEGVLLISSLDYLRATAKDCPSEQAAGKWNNALFRVMSNTLAYLGPGQLQDISTAITPACAADRLPVSINGWLTFFRAYSVRNYPVMLQTTMTILESRSSLTTEQARFLYVSLLAGLIKVGGYQQADNLWRDYLSDLYKNDDIPLAINILLGLHGRHTSERF